MSNVIQNHESFVSIDLTMIESVKFLAQSSPMRRARINLHHQSDNLVQEMVIALCRDTLIRPHRHIGKTESLHAIQGRTRIVFFDNYGRITRKICIGDIGSGFPVLYRISSPEWHTVLPIDDVTVLHEVAEGPFDVAHNSYPEWGPQTDDELRPFLSKLIEELDEEN